MARSLAVAAAPPEGALAGLFRRIRWAFGLIRPSDLSGRSDADLVALAEDFARRNKPRHAITVLNAFGQRTTVDPRILQRYGDVSSAVGAHEAAVFSYLQAAELHVQAGMASKASAVLLQLVRLYPDHVDARLSLARVLEALQRNKEAAANYAVVVRILEAHGQLQACPPLLNKIAELWPQARADYHGPPVLPPAASAAPVVRGEPSPSNDDGKPIEIDLQSLISAYALEPAVAVHHAPTVSVGTYDPGLLAQAGREPSTVCEPEDPWLGNRPMIGAAAAPSQGGDLQTASYAAIDSDRTLMDLRGIDVDTSRDHPVADATILDLAAIRDDGAARVFDLTDTATDGDDAASPRRFGSVHQRR